MDGMSISEACGYGYDQADAQGCRRAASRDEDVLRRTSAAPTVIVMASLAGVSIVVQHPALSDAARRELP